MSQRRDGYATSGSTGFAALPVTFSAATIRTHSPSAAAACDTGGRHRDFLTAATWLLGDGAVIAILVLIRFFMPADKTMQSLPAPNDESVRLVTVPVETVAVRRFSGSRSHRTIGSQTAQLLATLRETGFEPTCTPVAWFYDPPWTLPMLRRNEIAVPVEPNS
jgi:hypothetical protein